MIKIYGLIGTNKKEGSCYYLTMNLIKLIEKIFSAKNLNIEYKLDYICDYEVKECIGCCNCFKYGNCVIDDDIKIIKDNIKECDIFIISAPVYLNQITGTLKKVLDRIAYWSHLMPLIGKRGIILVNSSFSGTKESKEYLEMVLSYFGVSVDYTYMHIGKVDQKEKNFYNEKEIEFYAHKFFEYDFKIDENVRKIFDNYHQIYNQIINSCQDKGFYNNELTYWKKNYLNRTIDEINLDYKKRVNEREKVNES